MCCNKLFARCALKNRRLEVDGVAHTSVHPTARHACRPDQFPRTCDTMRSSLTRAGRGQEQRSPACGRSVLLASNMADGRAASRLVVARSISSSLGLGPAFSGFAAELMQKSSSFSAARRHVWGGTQHHWADWLFEEADALQQQRQGGLMPGRGSAKRTPSLHRTTDLCAREAMTLIPLLALHSDAVFAEVGLHCRGRLPLNLALNCTARECISVCPDLQLTVDASQLCSPILQAGLPKCPVTFICSELHQYHFRGVTHVLLHNQPDGGVDAGTCRAIAARLATSPSFQLLITTAPLPFQPHLVHIGDAGLQSAPGTNNAQAHSQAKGGKDYMAANSRSNSHPGLLQLGSITEVHIYSTSFAAAPIGTISSLYCHTGVCCLPTSVFHALPSQAKGLGTGKLWLELPPLAAHTAAVQDLCSSL